MTDGGLGDGVCLFGRGGVLHFGISRASATGRPLAAIPLPGPDEMAALAAILAAYARVLMANAPGQAEKVTKTSVAVVQHMLDLIETGATMMEYYVDHPGKGETR